MRGCLFFLVVVLFCGTVHASPVDINLATKAAQKTMDMHVATYGSWSESASPTIIDVQPLLIGDTVAAYNFVIHPSGHIVVSGSDLLSPVLLYSTSSSFDPQMADAAGSLESWIIPEIQNAYRHFEDSYPEKRFAVSSGYDSSKVAQAWDAVNKLEQERSQGKLAVAGPILATKWAQEEYYNQECPLLGGEPTLVGCVATAWSQILKYWNWPDKGVGSHSYFWVSGNKTLSQTFDTAYDWDNMPDELTHSSTQEEINAVSKLCYDVGIAAEMDYGVSASGSNMFAHTALPKFFKYKDTATYHKRGDYTADAWMAVIKAEFEATPPRPIAYSIYSYGGGHEIVIDGYQEGDTDKVHVNMGWSGSYNGYYDVTQNFEAGWTWSGDYQQVVTGIEPLKGPSLTSVYGILLD